MVHADKEMFGQYLEVNSLFSKRGWAYLGGRSAAETIESKKRGFGTHDHHHQNSGLLDAVLYTCLIRFMLLFCYFRSLSISVHRACLADCVPSDREERKRSAHDRDQPCPDHDVGIGDLDLHHLDDGSDARHNQRGADEVLRLLLATVGSTMPEISARKRGGCEVRF